ncbi:hypothetical protein AB3S75_036195 [Citrus x aurantiifolia]
MSVDARFWFPSFYDQDPCSINFTTTRRSPRKASSPEVPAYTNKSEYAGCFPGANPPTLKSDMKASPASLSSAFSETVWDSDRCVLGKRGVLRVTPRFRGKRGCRGSVRSCVLRHVSGESVVAGVRWDLACYAIVLGKAWWLCLDSRAGEHVWPTAVDRFSSPLDLWPERSCASYRTLASRTTTSWTSRIFLLLFFRAPGLIRYLLAIPGLIDVLS